MAATGRPFTIVPEGAFSLRESAEFGFGQRAAGGFDGVMRLAFCVDGYREHAGVELRERADGTLEGLCYGQADLDAVRSQVMRVLSLDYDARPYERIGERDPVVAALMRKAPGLRPPLFYSPYEAAAWAIVSARKPTVQAQKLRAAVSEAYGRPFVLAGTPLSAFPTPERLLEMSALPGLPPEKIARLHGVAHAALEGRLDVAHLKALGPDAATAEVQTLKGLGPFYSALVVIRGTGFADVLPANEPRGLEIAGRLYGLGGPATSEQLEEIARNWKPFRTWVLVLLRAAGDRPEPGTA